MEQMVIDLARDALLVVIKVSAPMLLMGLTVGLIVSIFQTVTSIQESTLAFIPKILAVFVAILIFGPWMLTTLLEYINNLYTNMNMYIR
ncbi:MAG: flagellar biosynthesis protein FliQ [Epulopiscium sp.]|jgi:flagellar biosynthetic protein FliQ|uniref:flagellar biosynthesis protein FliQ n=1 Tax=Defluviitalea raffinosedens TaxID=1450156 RepID=UPI00175F38E9|nr:flagellar biosynthesis protein FliQ [Defluviitalea raffinosedens]MBM7685192.1 flagellar biosynthetic protein FliQ [Defluviitalea raffinosedens]MDK2787162.1 flagellar biosynthesis protein FliQ [Candidatus Epulonipiscium sp.]HHW67369.1 flagellar biosynthesis protein FliQ [Candidatus Epulonipiscium sp.]